MLSEEQHGSSQKVGVLSQQPSAEPAGHNSDTSAPGVTSRALTAEESGALITDAHESPPEAPALSEQATPAGATQDAVEHIEIENLFATMDEVSPIVPGEVVRCKVLKIADNEAILDVGLKS